VLTGLAGGCTGQHNAAASAPDPRYDGRCLVRHRLVPRVRREGAAKSWDSLCRDSKALAILNFAQSAQRNLDSLLVVPADVRVQCLGELLDAC
jgi:hypothetical protein